jgi:ribose transport system substrate-binding protein
MVISQALHSAHLQGLPAPVLAGREAPAGCRAGGRRGQALHINVDITFDYNGPKPGHRVGSGQADRDAQAALAKNPAAICFAALDTQAAIPLLEEAQARAFRWSASTPAWTATFRSPRPPRTTLRRPALAADKMAELIGGEGQVAVLVHDQTSRTGIDRRDGFVNRIAEAYPNIEIVNIDYGGGDHLRPPTWPRLSSRPTLT